MTQPLVDMVVIDARPAAIIEGTGFKRLVKYLELGYIMPSAVYIGSSLRERCSPVKSVVLKHLRCIALTSDIWTSLATVVHQYNCTFYNL